MIVRRGTSAMRSAPSSDSRHSAAVKIGQDELIECWMLAGEELGQVAGKRGATRLGSRRHDVVHL
jgi:hypothetical protein